jgi:hypothetical protein
VKGGITHPNKCTQQQIYKTMLIVCLDAEKSQKQTITSSSGIARYKQENNQKIVESETCTEATIPCRPNRSAAPGAKCWACSI